MPDDLLGKPETAYVKMDEQQYKAEQELADRYRSFVAEILRLSLGGLAVFSFIYKERYPDLCKLTAKDLCAFSGVLMFAASAVCALVFLYAASEGLRWYIAGLRYRSHLTASQPSGAPAASGREASEVDYLAERNVWIIRCRWSKLLAAVMLALGGICMALAIFPFRCDRQ